MSYVTIEDFRGGLDRRRKRIVGQPGTLWECVNGVITRGGEVDKRRKFVPRFNLPEGTFGMESAAGNLYVFGSVSPPAMPSGVTYQRLEHPDGVAMSDMLDTEVFDGKIYAIAKFADESIHHYYDGERVADWDNGIVRAAMTDTAGIAEHLRALIDADPAYDATRSALTITIKAAVAGVPFTIEAETENVEGGTDDQSITLNETVANVTGTSETLATGSFRIAGGTSDPGVNRITSIEVDGVEILDTAVDWTTSHSTTAVAVANQINTFNSTPEYTATVDGSTVIISAVAGSGATPNGFVVAVTAEGDVTVDNIANMGGGVAAAGNTAQEVEAVIGGTFEVGDRFTITIDGKVFGSSGNPTIKGTFALTHKSKVHVLAGSLDQFSALNDPTKWNISEIGAGFQNMASQDAGSERLVSIGKFQGNLVFFSRRSTQLWYVDVDDSLNVLLQTLENTGTLAARSVLSFGDMDLFYLSDSGVRSLRQVSGTTNVYTNDVGTAIDDLLNAQLGTLTNEQIAGAVALVGPRDNRYWLTLDRTTYVFSYFPASKISAWSTFEVDFAISHYAVVGNRIYARSGDTIYLYGGDSGQVYDTDDDDLYTVTVSTPFMSAGQIATDKYITGFDLAVDGTWIVNLLHDPRNAARKTRLGIVTDDTYTMDDLAGSGYGPVFALEMICETPGAARIANLSLHFEDG